MIINSKQHNFRWEFHAQAFYPRTSKHAMMKYIKSSYELSEECRALRWRRVDKDNEWAPALNYFCRQAISCRRRGGQAQRGTRKKNYFGNFNLRPTRRSTTRALLRGSRCRWVAMRRARIDEVTANEWEVKKLRNAGRMFPGTFYLSLLLSLSQNDQGESEELPGNFNLPDRPIWGDS